MRNVTAVVVASVFVLTTLASQASDLTDNINGYRASDQTRCNMMQTHMFDGITLTEQQRQQIRDLMQQIQRDNFPYVDVNEIETLHRLIIAENFDEVAVKTEAEKIAQEQVRCQVEMAKVRNQMYRLLTPVQQAVLNKMHQQRMSQLRELSEQEKSISFQVNNH